MNRSRSPKEFLHKHSLSLAALGVAVLLSLFTAGPTRLPTLARSSGTPSRTGRESLSLYNHSDDKASL